MPCIEEHGGLSPVERAREVAHFGLEPRFVEIEQERHLEAEIAKLLRHGLGVVARIVELRHRDVSRIADDERDPPAGASACASAPRRTSTSSDRKSVGSMIEAEQR